MDYARDEVKIAKSVVDVARLVGHVIKATFFYVKIIEVEAYTSVQSFTVEIVRNIETARLVAKEAADAVGKAREFYNRIKSLAQEVIADACLVEYGDYYKSLIENLSQKANIMRLLVEELARDVESNVSERESSLTSQIIGAKK